MTPAGPTTAPLLAAPSRLVRASLMMADMRTGCRRCTPRNMSLPQATRMLDFHGDAHCQAARVRLVRRAVRVSPFVKAGTQNGA